MEKERRLQWLVWLLMLMGVCFGMEGLVKVWGVPFPTPALKIVGVSTFLVSVLAILNEVRNSKLRLRQNFYTGSPCAFLALFSIEQLVPRMPLQQVIDYQQGMTIFLCLGSAGVALFITLVPEDRFRSTRNGSPEESERFEPR